MRLLTALFAIALLGAALPAPQPPASNASVVEAPAVDDIAATERSVVRVVTVAISNGEVVGFGHGTGFAIAPDKIITNAHVVGDAAEFPDNVIIGIVPSEGTRSYPGRLLRIDRQHDLAVIQLQSGQLPPVSIFTGNVAQRQQVIALGYPGNIDVATAQSMDDYIRPTTPVTTNGIISAHDTIQGIDALVHDASISRGSSGGPLVDGCGRVVGVNSYVSRQDEGDSPFSFAITVPVLANFLRDAGLRFAAVSTPCVSLEEAAARARIAAGEAETAAAAAATARAQRELARANELDSLREDARNRRELFAAFSALLLAFATVAGSGALTYHALARPRERRSAMIAAGVLFGGALLVFLLRPNPRDVVLPDIAVAPATVTPPLYGNLVCVVDRSRGRITVSAGEDSRLQINDKGCVNRRTQYVDVGSGLWSRTLVPENEATVTRITYDPTRRESVTRRYLLSLPAVEALRRQRGRANSAPGCDAPPEQIATLAARERAIAAMLPAQPNEEIISNCQISQDTTQSTILPRQSSTTLKN